MLNSDNLLSQDGQPTLAAYQAAATQIASPGMILNHLRIIGRCLAFRQLLARALVAEAMHLMPEATLGLAAAAVGAGDDSPTHLCDLAGLPWPSGGVDGLVCDVRPLRRAQLIHS